jgi:hypothetical protein
MLSGSLIRRHHQSRVCVADRRKISGADTYVQIEHVNGVPMSTTRPSDRKVSVGFTQQQWELIDRLKEERRWGATREEIVRNVLRDYVKQELGE